MFEKESEEYAVLNARQYIHNEDIGFCTSEEEVRQAYQKGAEFGYNKAFVEADKNLKAIVADFNKEKCELLGIIQGKDKVIQELEKENAKLKKQVENRNCSNCRLNKTGCPNDGSCHNFSLWQPFINPKLTKAKEIIKDYMTIIKGAHTTLCGVPEENRTIHVLKLNEKAEQFLNSEVE